MLRKIATPFQISLIRFLDHDSPNGRLHTCKLSSLIREDVPDMPKQVAEFYNEFSLLNSIYCPNTKGETSIDYFPLFSFKLAVNSAKRLIDAHSVTLFLWPFRMDFENLPEDGWEAVLEVEKRIGGFRCTDPDLRAQMGYL